MAVVHVTSELPFPALGRLHEAHEAGPLEAAEGVLTLLTDRVDEAFLARAPRLRAVANLAVGSDNVDLEACAARGVAVGVTPDVLTDATADLAMALLLSAARRLPEAAADVHAGRWRTWEPAGWLGLELRGATLLVVGPGRIGRATAERARAFGMDVRFAGRGEPADPAGADVVSLHAPLTPETRHLVDEAFLGRCAPHAVLVNTARGGLVDQEALAAALHEDRLGAAALDVTDPEPLPPDHPLLRAPRLLVTPHIGSATHAARERMAELAVANLLAALDGQPMPHPAG